MPAVQYEVNCAAITQLLPGISALLVLQVVPVALKSNAPMPTTPDVFT